MGRGRARARRPDGQPDDEHHGSPGRAIRCRWRWPTSSCCRPTSRPTTRTPHVIYDSLHGRWVATEISWDCDTSFGGLFGTGYIDFAVSQTADPTGTWNHGFFYLPDQLPNGPAPGTSTDKVAIASNLYNMTQGETSPGAGDCLTGATLDQGDIVYMDWPDLIDGGAFDAAELPLGSGDVQPARRRPGAGDERGAPAALRLRRRGRGHRSDLLHDRRDARRQHHRFRSVVGPDRRRGRGPMARSAPARPGRDRTRSTRAVDGRPTDALWQADRLVTVSTYPCGTGPRDCVRVTELGTAGVTDTVPTHRDPGLPRPGVGQGRLHGRDRARRERHPPRRLDALVRERRSRRRTPPTNRSAMRPTRSVRPSCSPPGPARTRASAGATTSAWPRTRRSRARSGTATSTPAVPSG